MDTFSKNLGLILLATGVIGLSACSSKPSPWTQQSSPWSSREGEVQEPVEGGAMPEEQSPFVDEAAMNDSMAAEPMGAMAGGAIYEEPVEPLPMEPMMAAGDIRSQPPGYFTVQLVASSSMKNLMAFVQRHNLSDQWIAETNVNGRTWFVLLSGVYASKNEAANALADARARLDTSPWIRTVGSLQAVMVP